MNIVQILDKKNNNIIQFFNTNGESTSTSTYQELHALAMAMAGCLKSKYKLCAGNTLGLIAETRKEFVCLFFACQIIGVIPCILPFKLSYGGIDKYIKTIRQMVNSANVDFLVCPEKLLSALTHSTEFASLSIASYENITAFSAKRRNSTTTPYQDTNNYPAYIQFTSGTTTHPKPLYISHAAAHANINAILTESIRITDKDKAFSWLPFYHDMGFLGFMLAPLAAGISIDYISPSTFARKPSLWLELMSSQKSTITYAPEFAYMLAMLRCRTIQTLDLCNLRIAGVGADMVHWANLKKFAATMAPTGFKFNSFKPSYGLAEATLAVSLTPDNQDPYAIEININGKNEKIVSSGMVLSNFELSIHPCMKAPLIEDVEVGEILLKGPSLATQPTQHPLTNNHVIPTGDIGFLKDNHLFILGRAKDIIIINGQNFSLPAIEWQLKAICGEYRIQIIAISHPNLETEQDTLLILATAPLMETKQAISQKIIAEISNSFGIACTIDWIHPSEIARTSSGKLVRAKILEAYHQRTHE